MNLGANHLRDQLQAQFDAAHDGNIELAPGEYPGPLVLRKSLTIEGNGATLWALNGPVLIVDENVSVELKNLRIEVTGEDSTGVAGHETAIVVRNGAKIDLDDVEIRGGVEGMPAESGPWRYPKNVYLGHLPPMQESTFLIRIATATACKIVSGVSGVEFSPSSLPGGPVELTIRVDSLRRDTMLLGNVFLKTAFSKRWFVLNGQVAASNLPASTQNQPKLVWQPSDWDSLPQLFQSPPVHGSAPVATPTSKPDTPASPAYAPMDSAKLGIFGAAPGSTPLAAPGIAASAGMPTVPKTKSSSLFPTLKIPKSADQTANDSKSPADPADPSEVDANKVPPKPSSNSQRFTPVSSIFKKPDPPGP